MTTVNCPECETPMGAREAWAEAADLVVVALECPKCGYSEAAHIRFRFPAVSETELPPPKSL